MLSRLVELAGCKLCVMKCKSFQTCIDPDVQTLRCYSGFAQGPASCCRGTDADLAAAASPKVPALEERVAPGHQVRQRASEARWFGAAHHQGKGFDSHPGLHHLFFVCRLAFHPSVVSHHPSHPDVHNKDTAGRGVSAGRGVF